MMTEKKDKAPIEWDGRRWYLIGKTGYYKTAGTGTTLHRAIYEKAHGPLPPGHVVHHKDGNRANNDIDNLVAMVHRDHDALHGNGQYDRGRLAQDRVCEECGTAFTTTATRPSLTCSKLCWQRRHRRLKREQKMMADVMEREEAEHGKALDEAVCWIDDDAHHMEPCNNCNGEHFAKPECRPARCPICEKRGHESSYIRVLKRPVKE